MPHPTANSFFQSYASRAGCNAADRERLLCCRDFNLTHPARDATPEKLSIIALRGNFNLTHPARDATENVFEHRKPLLEISILRIPHGIQQPRKHDPDVHNAFQSYASRTGCNVLCEKEKAGVLFQSYASRTGYNRKYVQLS